MSDSIPSDIASLFSRFTKVGWVKRSAVVGEQFSVGFTPLGLRRMDALVESLRDLRASGIEPTSLAAGELGGIISELLPPNFSQSEFIALLGMIESFSKR